MKDEIDLDQELNLQSATNEDDEFQKLLNDFIASELQDIETVVKEVKPQETLTFQKPQEPLFIDEVSSELSELKEQERALFLAYQGFCESIENVARKAHISSPSFSIEPDMLVPNYKPSIGRTLANDTYDGWDVLIEAFPDLITHIDPSATDDELLNFAERATDTGLTLAVISYVETIIELEGCEITYEERKLKYQRKQIERQIYEEHQKRIERSKKYITAIQKKKFPINAERLVTNFFKTSQKDPEGAYNVLTTNPAVFAPIEIHKIKPRFFGFLKVTPQDGIRVNIELADFLKRLKV